ncbi:MAG: hypothetical protein RLZZ618_1999 [Pseudomonadota bacterium]
MPFCVVIPGFLSADECGQLIDRAEAQGFASAAADYPPSYRNNDRFAGEDPVLSAALFARLRPHVPDTWPADDVPSATPWRLHSINPLLRYCRYLPGQAFHLHQDGVCHRHAGLRSWLTFMVYLTDGDAFEGGDTLFHDRGPGPTQPIVRARVRPRAGSLILFDHALWHAGDTVTSGMKHILRSDVLYERTAMPAAGRAAPTSVGEDAAPFTPAHRGYVWALAHTGTGLVASAGRDCVIRLWHTDGRSAGALSGHTRSVLAMAALPGGRLASVSRDRSLRTWDLQAQALLHQCVAHEAACLSVLALPEGELATGAADGRVVRWSPSLAQRDSVELGHGWVWSMASVNDTSLAAACEDGCVVLWNHEAAQVVGILQGTVPLRSVDAAHGLVVTGDISGQLQVWRDGEPLQRFAAHGAAVRRVRWLDADTVATASEDGTVRVWRWADQRLVAEDHHTNFATDVLMVGPGQWLSCGYDGELRVLQADMGA